MKKFNTNKFQFIVLRLFYKLFNFNLRGDLSHNLKNRKNIISCLIISNKIQLLRELLSDLKDQNLAKDFFEVIVIFDLPDTQVLNLVLEYQSFINIQVHLSKTPLRVLSDLRNISVSLAKGEFLLFLDDDTRIYQKNFLKLALSYFEHTQADVILPQANSLYGIVKEKYDFLDRFSFTNRCSFYRAQILEELGGFLKGVHTYEDTEFSIRLMIKQPKVYVSENLNYYHPPLFFELMQKPLAIGQAIFQLRNFYPFVVWVLIYLNALRFLPLGLVPISKHSQWFKISLGVFLFNFRKGYYYY